MSALPLAIPYAVAAYLLGSIPTGYLVGRLAGVDLRSTGSGNPGGTNAFRVIGPVTGVAVVLVDAAKGFVPAWYFPVWDGSGAAAAGLVYGACAIAGHVWPVFLRFRGGKGVATAAGVLVAVAPLAALVSLLVWSGTLLLLRTVAVASLAAATLLPVIAYVAEAPAGTTAFAAGVSLLVWWTHRSNVHRLSRGEEGAAARTPHGAERG